MKVETQLVGTTRPWGRGEVRWSTGDLSQRNCSMCVCYTMAAPMGALWNTGSTHSGGALSQERRLHIPGDGEIWCPILKPAGTSSLHRDLMGAEGPAYPWCSQTRMRLICDPNTVGHKKSQDLRITVLCTGPDRQIGRILSEER